MAESVTIPPAEQIAARICECREEMAALKRLYRLALAAKHADVARTSERVGSERSVAPRA